VQGGGRTEKDMQGKNSLTFRWIADNLRWLKDGRVARIGCGSLVVLLEAISPGGRNPIKG